jgi:tRNA threonylcarbamoyladenosine biosynthesis protein TsaE
MILADMTDTEAAGQALAQVVKAGDVITLSGALGVGKTALVRTILAALGHQGEVPSPTFAIVQPYETRHPPVWHADLYRIQDPSELDELGLDAASDGVLLVEWPEQAGDQYWPEALQLTLDFRPNGARRLTAKVPRSWQSLWQFH